MKKPRGGFDPHQLRLNWAATSKVAADVEATPPAAEAVGEATPPEPRVAEPPAVRTGNPDLVQVLRWDFVNSFPDPLPEAIEAGVLSEDHLTAESLEGIQEELIRLLLKVLVEQDEVAEARRLGIDPKTKAKPRTPGGKERLKNFLITEPVNLERTWQALIGTHEAAFGGEGRGRPRQGGSSDTRRRQGGSHRRSSRAGGDSCQLRIGFTIACQHSYRRNSRCGLRWQRVKRPC